MVYNISAPLDCGEPPDKETIQVVGVIAAHGQAFHPRLGDHRGQCCAACRAAVPEKTTE